MEPGDATRDATAEVDTPPAEGRAASSAPSTIADLRPRGAALDTAAFAHVSGWPGLPAAAAEAGIRLTGEQQSRLDRYRDLLLDRSQRVNLTAVRDPAEVERRLFLDALLMLPVCDALLPAAAGSAEPPRLVDVGSGAGFPGLVLKIARPDWRVTLIEATGKKVAFLDEAIRDLGLAGVTALHVRAEQAGRDLDHRGQYDLATARGVASLPVLLELCVPLLRRGGHALFPKGLALDEELAAARRATSPLGVRLLAAEPRPGAEATTRLVVAKKSAPTPAHDPRRDGLPAQEPLGGRLGAAGSTTPATPPGAGSTPSPVTLPAASGRRSPPADPTGRAP